MWRRCVLHLTFVTADLGVIHLSYMSYHVADVAMWRLMKIEPPWTRSRHVTSKTYMWSIVKPFIHSLNQTTRPGAAKHYGRNPCILPSPVAFESCDLPELYPISLSFSFPTSFAVGIFKYASGAGNWCVGWAGSSCTKNRTRLDRFCPRMNRSTFIAKMEVMQNLNSGLWFDAMEM